jgi:4-amino-4-deoxy-L-arabinose transferase-like glycosyltransferase
VKPVQSGSVGGERRTTLVIGCAVVAFAAVLRLWRIGDVPYGLHGDEALTGLDAQRILAEGWIGPYVYPSGLGQPAGPLYFTALLFRWLPQTMTTLRASMALFGVATVGVCYALGCRWFDRPAAVIASILLAAMPWHFHLSRTGLMVTTWPFAVLVTCWALTEACRTNAGLLWSAVAGVIAGFGVYTYNAYPLALPLYLVGYALAARRDRTWRPWLLRAGVFLIACLVLSTPMILYAVQHPFEYSVRHAAVALFWSDGWRDASAWQRLGLFGFELQKYAQGLLLGGRPDFADGLSAPGYPPLNPVVAVAALLGFGIAVRRRTDWPYGVLVAAPLILPWGALLSIGNGDFRRSLALAPFVAMLAALPLAALWARRDRRWSAALVAGLLAVVGWDVLRYADMQRTDEMRHVFAPELRAVAEYVATLPPDAQVNFFSDRWSIDYEALRFLLPDVHGVNRSREFRAPDRSAWDGVTRPAVFIFLGRYLQRVAAAQAHFPGGTVDERVLDDRVLYRAYAVE